MNGEPRGDELQFDEPRAELRSEDSEFLRKVGTTVDNKYLLTEYLGCGGTGSVYKAHHIELDNDVALKIMHARFSADAEAVKRFQREAQIIAELRHRNIVSVFAFGAVDGLLYMVMELLQGISLHQAIAESPSCSLTPPEVLPILLQVCSAMTYAHQNGVLHRDLKPDNVIIVPQKDGTKIAKVVDFGLARLVDGSEIQRLTQTGEVVGDPNYMSPEQAQGHQLDGRSDVYSFGCLLYETFTGQPPFIADNPVVTLMKQVTSAPEPFAKRKNLPPALESITMKAMAKKPEHRFDSFETIADVLKQFSENPDMRITITREEKLTGGTTTLDAPEPLPTRGRLARFILFVVVLACGGTATHYWMTQRVERQSAHSEESVALHVDELKLRRGQQPVPESAALELLMRAERADIRDVAVYAKFALADTYFHQKKYEQALLRAYQIYDAPELSPAQRSYILYVAARSAFLTEKYHEAQAFYDRASHVSHPYVPLHKIVADQAVVKLSLQQRSEAERLISTLDRSWYTRNGTINENVVLEMWALCSAHRFDEADALKERIMRTNPDTRGRVRWLSQYAVHTADAGSVARAHRAIEELKKIAKRDSNWIDNKIAVCELFVKACSEENHEEVVRQGTPLLERLIAEARSHNERNERNERNDHTSTHENKAQLGTPVFSSADAWDIQYCAESLGRALQALGRYDEAARLKSLRRAYYLSQD